MIQLEYWQILVAVSLLCIIFFALGYVLLRRHIKHVVDKSAVSRSERFYVPPDHWNCRTKFIAKQDPCLADRDLYEMSDTEILDYLQALTNKAVYTGKVILRKSRRGRGWRLHETSRSGASRSVREAVMKFAREKGLSKSKPKRLKVQRGG